MRGTRGLIRINHLSVTGKVWKIALDDQNFGTPEY